ncbi:MAG: SGNH/GDSL hydrolase family protein [Anaerolineales bacterium]|nr:SGNH/GDSL hydrolase family protein [Anaerolineales bacterium]
MKKLLLLFFATGITLSACGTMGTQSISPAQTLIPLTATTPALAPDTSATPLPTISPTCTQWQKWPVIPNVSKTSLELYMRGLTIGNNPHAFSKIGNGEISTTWFLGVFDLNDEYYVLGEYQKLSTTIEHFRGSFGRVGFAARRGFNTNLILNPTIMENSPFCYSGESPLGCELRVHQPSFAIISLGTNQVWNPEEFETGLRQILDILTIKGVLPILSTKGDNLEGDHSVNRIIACLAQEYDIPLWNFWLAIQALPNKGLQPDLEHLTYYGINDLGNKEAMQYAWTIRNLTVLQVLESMRQGVIK